MRCASFWGSRPAPTGTDEEAGPSSRAATRHGSSSSDTTGVSGAPAVELPMSWWRLLAQRIDPHDLPRFSRVSKELRTLVLETRTVAVAENTSSRRTQEALARTVLQCRSVHLAFFGTMTDRLLDEWDDDFDDEDEPGPDKAAEGRLAHLLLSCAARLRVPALHSLTAITLTEMVLSDVVPAFLAASCPHLTRFVAMNCDFAYPMSQPRPQPLLCPALPPPPACSRLVELAWDNQALGADHLTSVPVHATAAALALLPALQRLALQPWDATEPLLVSGSVTRLVAAPRMNLDLPGGGDEEEEEGPRAHNANLLRGLPAQFPLVQHLVVPALPVRDAEMEALLQMGSVRHLACRGFELQRDYARRAAPWRSLRVERLNGDALGRLPLGGIRSFKLARVDASHPWARGGGGGEVEEDEEAVPPPPAVLVGLEREPELTLNGAPLPDSVLAALARWGGIARRVQVEGCGSVAEVEQALPAAAAVMGQRRGGALRVVGCRGLTARAVQQLGAAVRRALPHLAEVALVNCQVHPKAWGAVLGAFKGVLHITLAHMRAPFTVEQLATACQGALPGQRVHVQVLGRVAGEGGRELSLHDGRTLPRMVLALAGKPRGVTLEWSESIPLMTTF